ncbi:MAG TPA: serine/threonine protein kinase, partial [Polyangiaceae bacterium]|nr:serine/threonine protein kinase [Polyangiaceae bacterium]
MAAPLTAPSLVQWGPYRPLVRFASGGMAEVWAAAKTGADGFEKIVAVKRMLPNLEDERFETMFHDEAQLAAHVRSPHVVSTIDLGRADDGSLYIAMELVNGVSLAHLLRQMGRAGVHIPAAVAVEILAQACQGLADAHEARMPDGTALDIVHRDVSPQNLLIDRSGVLRVTDFGVARAVERLSKTETGDMRGKVGYFSPEQSQGKGIDLRTDIFALGIVAHEMITQKRLFRDENAWLTVQNVLTGDIPSLAGVHDVSAELDAVILRALARDKEKRWQSA